MRISGQHILIILLFLMFAAQACAQKGLYDEIEDFYQGTKKEGYSYDPPLRFITENDIPLKDDQGIIQIFLIRHGIPKIDRANWVSYYQASNFVKAYDTVEVYEIKDVPVNIRADEIDNVYSSPLRRARSTAEQLFGQRFNIIYDSLFREFRNEIVPIPRIRLPLSVWRVSSRIFWMVGLHSSEVPGLPEERRRANRAAEQLANMAKQEGHVVLVAHGFINRFIIRYLKKNGWQHSYDGGFEYTNVQVLSKIIENYPAVEVD